MIYLLGQYGGLKETLEVKHLTHLPCSEQRSDVMFLTPTPTPAWHHGMAQSLLGARWLTGLPIIRRLGWAWFGPGG